MNTRKSVAFPPTKDSVSRHMQSHYRRVEQVQMRVDTSTPKSFKNGKDKRKCSKTCINFKVTETSTNRFGMIDSLQNVFTSSQRKSRLSDGSNTTTNWQNIRHSSAPSTTVITDTTAENHQERRERGDYGGFTMNTLSSVESAASSDHNRSAVTGLLELSSVMEQQQLGRWRLYHTQTGRITGYLREKQQLSSAESKRSNDKPPWKPPWVSPSDAITGSTPQSTVNKNPLIRVASASSDGRSDVVVQPAMQGQHKEKRVLPAVSLLMEQRVLHQTSRQSCPEEIGGSLGKSKNGLVSHLQLNSESDLPQTSQLETTGRSHVVSAETESVQEVEGLLGPSSSGHYTIGLDVDLQPNYYSKEQLLMEGAELRLKSQAVARRVEERRWNYRARELDCRYLQFVCEVVEDILSRGVLSEPAMDLLFQTHVDHHKNHLREDEMLRRLRMLKKQIFDVTRITTIFN